MSRPLLHRVDGKCAVRLILAAGRGNALGPALLDRLEQAFLRLEREGATPVVLAAEGPVFCSGLDLRTAYSLDRSRMSALMGAFHRALRGCFLYPGPVVAALGGHTLAGGALLALACDRRLAAPGAGRFGIHGIHLGVAYPDVAVEILRHQLPRRDVEELLYEGQRWSMDEAHNRGFVHGVLPADELLLAAESWAAALGSPSLLAFAATKRAVRQAARRRLEGDPRGLARWLDVWFHPDTRQRVGEALRSLGASRHSNRSSNSGPGERS